MSFFQTCTGRVIDRAQQKENIPQAKSVIPPSKSDLVVASLTGREQGQQKRNCFHPGVSSLSRDGIGVKTDKPIKSSDMTKAMFSYIWPQVSVYVHHKKNTFYKMIPQKMKNEKIIFFYVRLHYSF